MGGEVSLHCSHFLLVIQLSVTQVYHRQGKTCKNLGRIQSRIQKAVVRLDPSTSSGYYRLTNQAEGRIWEILFTDVLGIGKR
jgi:hypothetical protein